MVVMGVTVPMTTGGGEHVTRPPRTPVVRLAPHTESRQGEPGGTEGVQTAVRQQPVAPLWMVKPPAALATPEAPRVRVRARAAVAMAFSEVRMEISCHRMLTLCHNDDDGSRAVGTTS
jgi:hypothetical protein